MKKDGTAGSILKQLPGSVRTPPADAPRVRAYTGVIAATPISGGSEGAVSSCSALAVVTLSDAVTREGELTILTVSAGDDDVVVSSMIVARHAFILTNEPQQGISKVMWAGVAVVAVMSCTGEVLCLRSGLREELGADDGHGNDSSSEGEEDAALLMRVQRCAIDMCALVVHGKAVVVTTSGTNITCCSFSLSRGVVRPPHEQRELSIGAFQLLSGVSSYRDSPALLLGCTLGSVVLFEWTDCAHEPVACRSFIMGPSTRYVSVAPGVRADSGTAAAGRVATFCLFGGSEGTVEGSHDLFVLNAIDGKPLQVLQSMKDEENIFLPYAQALPPWNDVCCTGPRRPQTTSSLLLVTQPQLCTSSAELHVVAVTVTQSGVPEARSPLNSTRARSGAEGKGVETVTGSPNVNIKVFLALSAECKKAICMFTPQMAMASTLRYRGTASQGELAELCLFDGERAVVFGLRHNNELEPRFSVDIRHEEGTALVGVAWLSSLSKTLLMLLGKIVDNRQGFLSSSKDELKCGAKGMAVRTLDELKLLSTVPRPWVQDVAAGEADGKLVELIKGIMRQGNEEIMRLMDRRLEKIERDIKLVLERQEEILKTRKEAFS